jgi:hypothetical protein
MKTNSKRIGEEKGHGKCGFDSFGGFENHGINNPRKLAFR